MGTNSPKTTTHAAPLPFWQPCDLETAPNSPRSTSVWRVHSRWMSRALTYPEDIIDKEAAEKDASCADTVQRQQLHSIDGEGQSKQVVGNPVLKKYHHVQQWFPFSFQLLSREKYSSGLCTSNSLLPNESIPHKILLSGKREFKADLNLKCLTYIHIYSQGQRQLVWTGWSSESTTIV